PQPTQTGLYRAGQAVTEAAPQLLPMTEEENKTWAASIGRTVGGMAGVVGTTLLGTAVGAPELGAVAGAAQFGAAGAGQQAEEARAKGATPEQVARAATIA